MLKGWHLTACLLCASSDLLVWSVCVLGGGCLSPLYRCENGGLEGK